MSDGTLRLVVGADDAGFDYKEILKRDLEGDPRVVSVVDVGVAADGHTAYPHVAVEAARLVAEGHADRALLVCGTGLGVAIAANKVPGIRAANCHDVFSAQMSREHNDANILTMGERVIGPGLAALILDTWLKTEFAGGRHARRVDKMMAYEQGRQS